MKIIDCHKVNPTANCHHVIRAETEVEVLRLAAAHAKEHGMQPSPELLAMVKQHVEDV